jgi:hypothetical protein
MQHCDENRYPVVLERTHSRWRETLGEIVRRLRIAIHQTIILDKHFEKFHETLTLQIATLPLGSESHQRLRQALLRKLGEVVIGQG